MIQDFLNSPIDSRPEIGRYNNNIISRKATASQNGHFISPPAPEAKLSSLGASAVVAHNVTAAAGAVTGLGASAATNNCGWGGSPVTVPIPCAGVEFPSVTIYPEEVAGETQWFLKFIFTSCGAVCNTWNISYTQIGYPGTGTGGTTIVVDCSHLPYIENFRFFPLTSHSPHIQYELTITSCCGMTETIMLPWP